MKIKLKESINSELIAVGLRPGDEISSNDVNKITGAVHFTYYRNSSSYDCVVWPEDYEIVEEEETQANKPLFPEIPQEITVSIAELTNALDAMHWCICPYLDNSDLSELPWIHNLIKSYNDFARSLPSPWNLQYQPIETY
jgi:hypothetical protein